jgi:hypothetical protein
MRKALALQVRPVINAIRKADTLSVDVVDLISIAPIEQAMLAIYMKVLPPFASMAYGDLTNHKSDDLELTLKRGLPGWDDLLNSKWVARARQYVQTQGVDRIRRITETTRSKVRQFVEDAIGEGWSTQRTAKELAGYTQALNKSRAIVVARTELVSAGNYGSYVGAKATGLLLDKIWLSTKDARTRDPHRKANGQKVDIDTFFEINGQRLMHPGDGNHGAKASNLVNCRCTLIYEPKG